jgi:hypothetical protein
VSNNEVRGNRVVANQSISAGIAIKGGGALAGSGHANAVDSNTVTDPATFAIFVESRSCAGDAHSAYSGNRISRNMVSGDRVPLIVDGGGGDTISYNILSGRGQSVATLIRASSGDAVIAQNVIR